MKKHRFRINQDLEAYYNAEVVIEAKNEAYDAVAYATAADAAKIKNQKETADICRKYLPIEIWNIVEN